MTPTYFILASILYAIAASLPFLGLTAAYQYPMAMILGVGTSICWTAINRSILKQDVVIYGMYYDSMLTLIYLIVPFLYINNTLTIRQMLGILLMVLGIFLTK